MARAFSAAQALALGMSRARLRSSDIEFIGRGLYRVAGTSTTELDIAAAILGDRTDAVVSGLSAARAWGFPLRFDLDEESWNLRTPLDLTGAPGAARMVRAGIRWHVRELPPEHRTTVRGVPVTTRERTLCDLVDELSEAELIAIGDHLVRRPREVYEHRRRPWTSHDRLAACVESRGARSGRGRLRRVLERIRVGADSPKETELRLALEDAGLPEPQLNVPIIGPDGEILHEPDLQWQEFQVAAEYEGAHHRSAEQLDRDIRRAETMRRIGWIEVRIVARDMRRGAVTAVQRVDAALREHGWDGRSGARHPRSGA